MTLVGCRKNSPDRCVQRRRVTATIAQANANRAEALASEKIIPAVSLSGLREMLGDHVGTIVTGGRSDPSQATPMDSIDRMFLEINGALASLLSFWFWSEGRDCPRLSPMSGLVIPGAGRRPKVRNESWCPIRTIFAAIESNTALHSPLCTLENSPFPCQGGGQFVDRIIIAG